MLAEAGERHEHEADRTDRIRDDFSDWLIRAIREHGVTLPDDRLAPILQQDIDLNTQGVEVWLERRKKRP